MVIFTLFPGSSIFPAFQVLFEFDRSKKCYVVIVCVLDENLPKTRITPPKPKCFSLTFLTF